ncbi:MAG: hypothetical protein K0V04_41575 [Deltaproteobacteria bacterium]|nr:hypothetical protein [Deltaproteobacteria bacterium]
MEHTATIKITGVLAQTGRLGRVRFAVCNAKTQAWVDAEFPDGDEACGHTWLAVDDTVFAVAAGVYTLADEPRCRTARARLRLTAGCQCPPRISVESLDAIWLHDTGASFPP